MWTKLCIKLIQSSMKPMGHCSSDSGGGGGWGHCY